MSSITPTVGRKVWFFESNAQHEPHDATVIKVWGSGPDAAVNLDVIDPYNGEHTFRTSVIVGDEDTPYPHYRWMPYQQAQAKQSADVGTTAAA